MQPALSVTACAVLTAFKRRERFVCAFCDYGRQASYPRNMHSRLALKHTNATLIPLHLAYLFTIISTYPFKISARYSPTCTHFEW